MCLRSSLWMIDGPVTDHCRLTTSQSVVDEMIRKMENFTKDLERIVGERTSAMEDAQKRADNLLSQVTICWSA